MQSTVLPLGADVNAVLNFFSNSVDDITPGDGEKVSSFIVAIILH